MRNGNAQWPSAGPRKVTPTCWQRSLPRSCCWTRVGQAVNLGPNTPLASLTRAMRELRPRLVWLSVSYLENTVEFLRSYREFYQAAERMGVAVAVGGQALVEPIRSAMPYTTHGDGLNHLAAFARTLHPRPKRPSRGRPPKH